MMKINYAQHSIDEAEYAAVQEVMQHGWLARGPKLAKFETAFENYVGCKRAVACANGSVALEIALRALGIGRDDEVIVPNISWVSTATAVNLVGATPVLCDVQEQSPNICLRALEQSISSSTKAIIVVHFAGIANDMTALADICEKHSLKLIEDAAHAVGGSYPDGSRIGSSPQSAAACFSFHPAKNMTTGEGGMITTQDPELAKQLALVRSNGVLRQGQDGILKAKYECLEFASNYHLNDIAAAIGLCQLPKLDDFVKKRAALWEVYNQNLSHVEGLSLLPHPSTSAFNLCILNVSSDRDLLFQALNDCGIGAYYHYPLIHELSVYKSGENCRYGSGFDHSITYRDTALTLPLHPGLTETDIHDISKAILERI